MNNRNIILEKMWLIIAIVLLAIAVIETAKKTIAVSYPLFIMSIVCYLMFLLRKNVRKNNENT